MTPLENVSRVDCLSVSLETPVSLASVLVVLLLCFNDNVTQNTHANRCFMIISMVACFTLQNTQSYLFCNNIFFEFPYYLLIEVLKIHR